MRSNLQIMKDQIHALIDTILSFDIESQLPESVAKQIAFQNIIIGVQASEKEIDQYFLDKEVIGYIKKYQTYCLGFEIHMENLITEALINPQTSSEIIRFLRNYYSNIYELMAKNEIYLANINKNSKVCMVGVGSMPLSMLFMHRFSGANVVGIDKSTETILSTEKCVEFVNRYAPNRYNYEALSVIAADGEMFNYRDFDVVILSIHITNKDAVIKRILDTNNNTSLILLDRQVVGLSQYFYKNNSVKTLKEYFVFGGGINSGVITTQSLLYKEEKVQ